MLKDVNFIKIPKRVKDLNMKKKDLEVMLKEIERQLKEAYKEVKVKCSGSFRQSGCRKYFKASDLTWIEFEVYNGEKYDERWEVTHEGFRCPECGVLTIVNDVPDFRKYHIDIKLGEVSNLFKNTVQEQIG